MLLHFSARCVLPRKESKDDWNSQENFELGCVSHKFPRPGTDHWLCLSTFHLPQSTECSSEGQPRLWWDPGFVWRWGQGRSLMLRGTQNSPRETPGSQSRHGKGAQTLEVTGKRLGSGGLTISGWARNVAPAENGVDLRLDSMLWEVFPSWIILGCCCQGWEWIWAAQSGTAMRHPLFPEISAK